MTLNMLLLKRRTTPPDPSNFLCALRRKLSTNKQVLFQFGSQQDVPEILQVVLDEWKGHSPIATNIIATSVRTSTTYDTCGCCNIGEIKLDIFSLPLAKSICLFLYRFLSSENLTGDNKCFCSECNGFMDSTLETKTVDSGSVLILQLVSYAGWTLVLEILKSSWILFVLELFFKKCVFPTLVLECSWFFTILWMFLYCIKICFMFQVLHGILRHLCLTLGFWIFCLHEVNIEVMFELIMIESLGFRF